MNLNGIEYIVLAIAAIPFVYYVLVLYSAWNFFSSAQKPDGHQSHFTPPVSNLKPIRGEDPDAYENFASFCRQDYPEYELIFCVSDRQDPVLPVIERLQCDFPEREIRVLFGSGRDAVNDKVAKLARMAGEAKHEILVISDSDVRVQPDYLRSVVAPLADAKIGAVTCFYVSASESTWAQSLQSVGMLSDFYPGILVARQLDGVKFALGPTIATTKTRLAEFGGYESIENKPADDLLVGRLIAEHAHEVKLLPYSVLAVADYQSFYELFQKRLRWIVVMRNMRPWGHLGLIFTHGLVWSLLAVALVPSAGVAAVFFGAYAALRAAATLLVGAYGLRQPGVWKKLPLILLWDAMAFAIWVISFTRSTIRWRDGKYYIRNGMLVPIASGAQVAARPAVPASERSEPLA